MLDRKISEEERIQIVDHFTQQLWNSGYSETQIKNIIISSLRGTLRKEERPRLEGGRRYKCAKDTLPARMRKKLLDKYSWYKEEETKLDQELLDAQKSSPWDRSSQNLKFKRNNEIIKKKMRERLEELVDHPWNLKEKEERKRERIQGVMYVQHNEDSNFAKLLREKLKSLKDLGSFKLKIVERTRDKVVDLLHKSNAWSNMDCSREDCVVCSSTDKKGVKGACRRRNITYETYCITCQKLEEERLKKELFQTEVYEEEREHALDREEEVEEILSTACLKSGKGSRLLKTHVTVKE